MWDRRSLICVILLTFWSATAGADEATHPLEPLDLSSPRATLNTFLTSGDALSAFLGGDYWSAPNRADNRKMFALNAVLESMFDLTEIPPAARRQLVLEAIYLHDVLSRIELPPDAEIPDAAAFADVADERDETGTKPLSWTIPHKGAPG